MAQNKIIPPELLTRGVSEIVVRRQLEVKLRSGKKLRIKHGVDPTTDRLHIGYGVTYWKLRQFQDLGHTVVFLIGDFTGRFGDPTEKLTSRTLRDKATVAEASAHYLDQIKGILDLTKTEVRYNSEWYDAMSAEELLRLMSNFSVAQMLERDMFAKRQLSGARIGLHEPVYPVLQGYDSVKLASDVTVVGSDQLFNELAARPLQTRAGQKPQDVMAMSLLLGTDGERKMSQSYGNTINITDSPADQFGKVMRIPDRLIGHYFELATLISTKELTKLQRALADQELAPREAKLKLATAIVELYHGPRAAQHAGEEFVRVFSRRSLPKDIPLTDLSQPAYRLDDLIVTLGFAASRTAAQRLITQGGVRIDEAVWSDWSVVVDVMEIRLVQASKRHFSRVSYRKKKSNR